MHFHSRKWIFLASILSWPQCVHSLWPSGAIWQQRTELTLTQVVPPSAHPTNGILTEFEIQCSYVVLLFIRWLADHNEILHMCSDMCKISLWLVEYILNQSTANFGWISNLMVILLVWQDKAITDWINVDLSSVRSIDIHLRWISQEILQPSMIQFSFKITPQ